MRLGGCTQALEEGKSKGTRKSMGFPSFKNLGACGTVRLPVLEAMGVGGLGESVGCYYLDLPIGVF